MTSRPRAYPRAVFLDSSANPAVIDANDANHGAARSIRRRLAGSRSRLVTTNYILDESYTLIMSELGTHAALAFLRDTRQSASCASPLAHMFPWAYALGIKTP